VQDYNSPIVAVTITDDDLNQIKFYWDLGTGTTDHSLHGG